MKFRMYIFLLLSLGCYKKNDETEAIILQEIHFKTTLKNHTPGADYVINKNLDIAKELIIEEGVEIIVEEGCRIDVRDSGLLIINGSKDKPVKIKSKTNAGGWNGIHITSALDNRFSHAEISGAGRQGDNHAAIELTESGKLTLNSTRITGNGNASGLLLTENVNCILNACELSGNLFPVQKDLFAGIQFTECNFTGNKYDMIRVINYNGSLLTAHRSLNILNYGLPYFFTSSLLLNVSEVTIDAGTTLLFEMGHGISTISSMYSGTLLKINGRNGSPVRLGSFHSGQSDLWRGISLGTGINAIQYAIFEKANTGNTTIGLLSVFDYTTIVCRNSNFNADAVACNISIRGKNVLYNSDIKTRNTFKNSKSPCIF